MKGKITHCRWKADAIEADDLAVWALFFALQKVYGIFPVIEQNDTELNIGISIFINPI
jgi:hypothetical protein